MSDAAGNHVQKAADAGSGDLPRAVAVLREGIEAGLHLGAQLYVWHRGREVASLALGQSRSGVAMTVDTLMLWMSMGKPLTAIMVALEVDAGRLDIAEPVARHIPAFAHGGKQDITIRHLLTHTGGFRQVASNWSSAPWEQVIERICAAELEEDWLPGETSGYHMASSWYILGEVVRRSRGTDEPFDRLIRSALLEPLGMSDCWIGMPRRRFIDYGTRIGLAFETARGGMKPMTFPNSEQGATLSRPGGNARGPLAQFGLFYRRLLADRGDVDAPGQRLLSRDVARQFTTRQRIRTHDRTFGVELDWGLGFLIPPEADGGQKRVPYGYGPHASADTFGHSGNQCACAFADPRHGLVACWATNGLPGELAHQRRHLNLNRAIYEDLGLAGGSTSREGGP